MQHLVGMKKFKDFEKKTEVKQKMIEHQRQQPAVLHDIHLQDYSGQYIHRLKHYTQSLALWTAYSLLVGLGDRHLGNILLIHSNSQLLFIDYESSFMHSKLLPVPELIPVRLTKNLRAALGWLDLQGLFRHQLAKALELFVKHKHEVLA